MVGEEPIFAQPFQKYQFHILIFCRLHLLWLSCSLTDCLTIVSTFDTTKYEVNERNAMLFGQTHLKQHPPCI